MISVLSPSVHKSKILWKIADHHACMQTAFLAQSDPRQNHAVRTYGAAVTDLGLGVDDREGAHL